MIERRESYRQQADFNVEFFVSPEYSLNSTTIEQKGKVVDISNKGFGIITDYPLQTGNLITLKGGGQGSIPSHGLVCWNRKVNGFFRAGFRSKKEVNTLYNQSISAIFPAYNEDANIKKTIQTANKILPKFTDKWEIIVVDDGSVDKTAEIVEKTSRFYDNISLIRHPNNRGYGAALKSGINAAKNDLVFFSDSDLQFDMKEMNKLINWIDEFEIVIGYRAKRKDPFYRRFNAMGWNTLVRLALGLEVKDIDCAFKLFRRNVFQKIKIDAVGAMVNTDILSQAVKFGFRLKEVPVTHYKRLEGKQTGANIRVILKAFKELFYLYSKLRGAGSV